MQEYALQWDNFRNTLASGFSSVYQLGDYVDCDLACEDGKVLQAHKIILGICSPYFRTMLARNPCKHPTFILKDINNSTMASILEFMYKGEVNVKQNDFKIFMKVAKMFKIKGLTDTDEENFIDVPVIPAPVPKYTSPPKVAKIQPPRPRSSTTSTPAPAPKRRLDSSTGGSSHKQIKYEEIPDTSDPLVQESIYEEEGLDDEEPDPEEEEILEQKFSIDIQPHDEMEQHHDDTDLLDDNEQDNEHDNDDDDDEFDDQGLTLLRETESPRIAKKEKPFSVPAPKRTSQPASTSYTSSTLNLHTAVKNLGLPPMPFSSYKDFITFENKVREDEELMAALKNSFLSIFAEDYKKFILKNLKLLINGSGIKRFVWRSATGDMIAIEKFTIMRIFEACAAKRYKQVSVPSINRAIGQCLKNLKTTVKKRMIKQGKFADYLNDDHEYETEEHILDPDDLLEPDPRPDDEIEQTSELV